MNHMSAINDGFKHVFHAFSTSAPFGRMSAGTITTKHYQSIMREVAHQAGVNPQLQALATVYFKGKQREVIEQFYRHAISEIGHDQLALNDAVACGYHYEENITAYPLPSTAALIAFPFHQITMCNPVGYLGYLFFLENMAIHGGKDYMAMLLRVGVPEHAMSFLSDHARIDTGHVKLMETYVDKLVTSYEDLESIVYAMQVTGNLYVHMLQGAIDQVDSPKHYGHVNQPLFNNNTRSKDVKVFELQN